MVRSLVPGLIAEGLEVRVAAMVPAGGPGERWVAQVRDAGATVVVLPPSPALHRDAGLLRQLLNEYPADVLHAHGYRSDILAALLPRTSRPALVATVHGFSPTNWRTRWYSRLDRLALRRFDRVLAVSGPIRERLIASGVKPGRVQVVHNGIDVPPAPASRDLLRTELGITPNDFVVGTVGRLSPEKGHRDLLRALALGPSELRLVLVGDGPERPGLEGMARTLGLDGRVTFLGLRHDVERLHPAFDLFALPSHTEGSPTALLEAFAYGTPVVATRVGAVPDMLRDEVEGVLVPPHSPALLAEALGKLFASAPLRQTMAERAKHRYETEFRRCHWLDSITAAYLEVLDQRPQGSP